MDEIINYIFLCKEGDAKTQQMISSVTNCDVYATIDDLGAEIKSILAAAKSKCVDVPNQELCYEIPASHEVELHEQLSRQRIKSIALSSIR